jgi:hypothetical protein
MRTALIVAFFALIILLVGGTLRIGGAPIFAHIDSAIGTNVLMTVHNSIFSFMQLGGGGEESGFVEFRESEIEDHNKRIMDATH